VHANWGRPGPDEVAFGRARSRPRRPLTMWAVLAAALVAAVAVIAVRSALSGAPSRPAVSVTFTGRPILGVRASWEVFAHGPRDLVAIDLARGKITTTVLPAEVSGNPYTWFLVGPDEAIIRSEGGVEPGYVVPDGGAARPLASTVAGDGPLLPGPVPGQAWRYSWVAGSPVMTLVTLAGRPVGATIALAPPHHPAPGMPAADGRGGVLLLESAAEAYDAGPDRRDQVNGQVIAVGPMRWLVVSCRNGARCRNVVYDPRSGAQRALPGPALAGSSYIWPPAGVVSPDGSAAAIVDTATAPPTIRLINLATGADSQIDVPSDYDAGAQSMAWSPDGRWLFVTDDGRLVAVNARTGRVTGLGVRLPDLSQVAVRPGPA
jgi:hypothetical protein